MAPTSNAPTPETAHATPVIRTRGLSRWYGGKHRRRGIVEVDLEAPRGVVYGFIGPNGAGKTTTIRTLLGFLRPSAGEASVFGLDCWSESHRIKARVGYLPGDLRLYPWLTLERALEFVGRVRGMDLRDPGRTLAERLGLEPDLPARRMSRGNRQKLGLIMTLAPDPDLLVLDEPTSALDPLVQIATLDLLAERAERGRTVFLSSHSLSEVEQVCSRVAIVRGGRIIVDEAMDSLRARARRLVRLEFANEDDAKRHPPPDSFHGASRHGREWTFELDGHARDLIEWAAGRPVIDLSIGQPDLQTVFRRFYEEGGRVAPS
ncbi:MAG: ABC transporter ATP-binding protein [Phycisphaerales bacterium]